jgi:NAD(P)H-dependent FMN reductase
MEQPLTLAIIIGSTREGRFGPRVAAWFAGVAREHPELTVEIIDLAEADLPVTLRREASPSLQRYRAQLERADAFVIVTPEYNHGYPAPLKQAIDLAYVEWQAKPVAFVSYGGMAGGLRAVEQLRQVFAEVHAVTVRDVVSLHNPWSLFDPDARVHESIGAEGAAKTMLDRLTWWANALRSARDTAPYAA